MNKTKNDEAWRLIFKKYEILDRVFKDGYFEITATQINEFREARLMTKFDHKSQLPELFVRNNLSILSISRGVYTIGKFEAFCDFDTGNVEVSSVEFPTFLESIDYKDITSEATALNCAFVSKILHDFTGEENLFPTVSGRMGSSSFSFRINCTGGMFNINVKNSQIEIDGGYEGDNSLSLIEAKNYISEDFIVRQLYYPYRLWNNKIHKQVKPIFLTYTNGIFNLREYKFTDENRYNSLILVKHRKYIIQERGFNLEALSEILYSTEIVKESEVPFPQANSFDRIINLCELLKQKEVVSKEEITENYDFDPRQTDYYLNAGKYLGLIELRSDTYNKQIVCFLTEKGRQIFNMNLTERQKEFVKLIVSHVVFKLTLINFLENGEMPNNAIIVEIMKRAKIHNIDSDKTYFRRASTITGWINWIVEQLEE